LKAGGYRIVHVVPATPERPKTVTDPAQWVPHWIHGPNVAAKAYPGFMFGAAETPHNAPRSERSVWLAWQRPATVQASVVPLRPSPGEFQIGERPIPADISAASRQRSLARSPGSWPTRPDDGTFRPITGPIRTGSRTDAPIGSNIR
jgi:hypothetical protein